METKSLAMNIKKNLGNLEGMPGARLQDVIDDEIFEVLAGVAWVREALAQAMPNLPSEDQRQVAFSLETLAA